MFLKKKALLATALTSASFVGAMLPCATWAAPNVTEECAPGTQIESTQCGLNSQAQAPDSTAIGESAVVEPDAENGTAIGANSIVKNIGGTAIGVDSKAEGTNSVAIGLNASVDELLGGPNPGDPANGVVSITRSIKNISAGFDPTDAVNMSQLNATNSELARISALNQFIAVDNGSAGGPAKADFSSSVAVGLGAVAGQISTTVFGTRALASGVAASAFGTEAEATAESALALGAGASSTAKNAVALGADSTANRIDSVSIGSDGTSGVPVRLRQLTNLKAGTEATDAVNKAQLDAVRLIAESASGGGTGSPFIKIDTTTATSVPDITGGQDAVALGGSSVATAKNALALGSFSESTEENVASFGNATLKRRLSEKATLSAGVGIGFETGEVGARGGFQVVW